MSKFEDLVRLKMLEANATPARWELTKHSNDLMEITQEDEGSEFKIIFEDSDENDPRFITDIRNAAPWLLSVAGAFQPGDAEQLKWILEETEDTGSPLRKMIARLQAAAEEIER